MKKKQPKYSCFSCGTIYHKWIGRCESCNQWNTVFEDEGKDESQYSLIKSSDRKSQTPLELTSFDSKESELIRLESGIKEYDRVCGGGMVPGSVILLGGDPGVGKSTLLLQIIAQFSKKHKCVYISGEESSSQLKRRALRLKVGTISALLASTTSLNKILLSLSKNKVDLLIIDSVQTMHIEEIDSFPGSVSQVRSVATEVINFCKSNNIVGILVGHVTREGQIAGPKVLEHMVDAVFHFEGDNSKSFRILRSIKNRFGSCDEIGIFEMSEQGLLEISNPSALFLSEYKHNVSGNAVFAGIEGSRAILIEVQTLIASSNFPTPRRSVVGVELSRLHMLMALLETRYKLQFSYKDVYVNIAGGLKVNETAVDLAICASLISSAKDTPLPKNSVFIGEVSLSGHIRNIFNISKRINESVRLGFEKVFIPKILNKSNLFNYDYYKDKINIIELNSIGSLIKEL